MSALFRAIERKLRELLDDAPPEEVAATCAEFGAIHPTKYDTSGDAAYLGGGGAGAGRFGQGAPKGASKEAARLVLSAPGCNLAVIDQGEVAIVDLKTRKVFAPRTVISVKTRSSSTRTSARRNLVEKSPAPPPQASSIKDALTALRRHNERRVALEKAAGETSAILRGLERRKSKAAQEIERTKARAGEVAAEAVQANKPMPDLEKERSIIQRAQIEFDACAAAIPAAEEALCRANFALEDHHKALVEVALDLDAALSIDALDTMGRVLLRLEKPLAALAAASLVRSELIGTKFTFDRRRHHPPVGGTEIAAAVVGGIPSGLCDGLDLAAIKARATEIATEILSQLKS